MGKRAFALGVVAAAIGMCAPSAWGALPGRDGDLVVATGNGLALVAPATGAARLICANVLVCGHPAQPSVSPNGKAIAFVDTVSHRPVVIAADGSCLWCLLGTRLTARTGGEWAFAASGHAVTVAGNGLWSISLTGGSATRLAKGPVNNAVWSSRGLVAVVRGGWIWVGRLGHGNLRRLARGRSPSFSPDGAGVALARDGYVWVVRVRDGVQRRLVRGGAPAWSPTGRRIAYIASGGAVEIIAVRGGRPYHVGSVHGTALDWQPSPIPAREACKPPRGSIVVASNREAVVFSRRGDIFYGCLKALGRTRLLLDASVGYFHALITVRLAGRFAALEPEYDSPQRVTENEILYDLGSGKATHLAGVSWDWNGGPTVYGLDFLALDSSGFAAWRQTTRPMSEPIAALSCPSASLCIAGDAAGNILRSTNPTGGAKAWGIAGPLSAESILGVSCPSASLCVAVGAGNVITSTGASAWTSAAINASPDLYAISCPSVSLCVAGGGEATIHGAAIILTSTDPTGGTSSWTRATLAPHDEIVDALSCPSVSLCVATTNTADVFTSTHPTGGASAWTKATADRGSSLTAVSCPSVSLCVAGDENGNILTSTDPTGGARAWTKATADHENLQGNSLAAVSCPSVSLCVAGDGNGNILTSTNPNGGAKTWTSATVDIPSCPRQSTPCISEQLHARDDQGARIVDTAPPGSGNSIGSVALDGNSLLLSWTHDGARRQLKLR